MGHPDYQTILVDRRGHILTLTLNRPEKRNPLGQQTVNELLWALDEAREDAEVRVVVLTGAGGTFSAGADLKDMPGGAGGLEKRGEFDDLLLRFAGLGKPTIARVAGYAMGGAVGVIACCDFAVACESAILATPEIKRGLFPMMIMAVMERVMSQRELLSMILLGERLTAQKALEIGLLTQVVADDALDSAVDSLADRLAAQSPTAIRMGLHAFHRQKQMPIEEALPYLREQLFALLGTEDAAEGLAAFFQKREPQWKGR